MQTVRRRIFRLQRKQWGQDKGIRQYADAPAERVSLKAKLEVMKAKVAGAEKLGKQMDKGKEVTI